MIGMPAARAFCSEPLIASALGTETARPSTFCDTAASISWASFWGSLFAGLQMSLTPSSLDACCAPFFTTDQNEPSSLWVTIAKVRLLPCVRSTLGEPPLDVVELDWLLLAVLLVVLSLPPPQPAATRATRASTATRK